MDNLNIHSNSTLHLLPIYAHGHTSNALYILILCTIVSFDKTLLYHHGGLIITVMV